MRISDWSSDVCSSDLGIGRHGAEFQPQAGENPYIGVVHGVVAGLRIGLVAIERVGVFHGEFASAQQSEAGTPFVAEFCLDVVEIDRKLAITVDFVARDIRSEEHTSELQSLMRI